MGRAKVGAIPGLRDAVVMVAASLLPRAVLAYPILSPGATAMQSAGHSFAVMWAVPVAGLAAGEGAQLVATLGEWVWLPARVWLAAPAEEASFPRDAEQACLLVRAEEALLLPDAGRAWLPVQVWLPVPAEEVWLPLRAAWAWRSVLAAPERTWQNPSRKSETQSPRSQVQLFSYSVGYSCSYGLPQRTRCKRSDGMLPRRRRKANTSAQGPESDPLTKTLDSRCSTD